MKKVRIAIMGVSGYSGNVLLELLLKHPNVEIKYLCSSRNTNSSPREMPRFLGLEQIPNNFIKPEDLDFSQIDCLFTATPNGIASSLVEKALNNNVKLIDLAADFRFKDKEIFEEWYSPLKAVDSKYLEQAVYGLSELNREKIKQTKILANPGCYPTASALPIIPLAKANLIKSELIVIDAKSGITGAGKKLEENFLFGELSENFSAYNILKHRHTPEIENSIESFGQYKARVKFTPHLLPIRRGILSTIYIENKINNINHKTINECLKDFYGKERFIKIVDELPQIANVRDTNQCHIYATYDLRSNLIILISVIDNLMKGAAGQALQNFNLMFGFEESLALI